MKKEKLIIEISDKSLSLDSIDLEIEIELNLPNNKT